MPCDVRHRQHALSACWRCLATTVEHELVIDERYPNARLLVARHRSVARGGYLRCSTSRAVAVATAVAPAMAAGGWDRVGRAILEKIERASRDGRARRYLNLHSWEVVQLCRMRGERV